MNALVQLVLRALTAITVVYHTLWACAPVTTLPPPLPMAKGDTNIGGGLIGGAFDLNAQTRSVDDLQGHINAQGWASVAVTDWLDAYWTGFLGSSSGGGTGAGLHVDVLELERLSLGVQASGGFAYYAASLPVAVTVTDQLILYTNPGITHGTLFQPSTGRAQPLVPIGLWWTSPRGIGLGAELGAQGYMESEDPGSQRRPTLMPYLALSVGLAGDPRTR